MNDDLEQAKQAATELLRKRTVEHKLVTPCCRSKAELKGTPAPRYNCLGCGAVYGTLEELVRSA